jgi:LPS export ABC transporter permease LptG
MKEFMGPFFLGVFIVTVILIGNYFFQLADLIIVKNVPIKLVLELLVYRLPEVIVETFPIAVLFAAMSAIGRLNHENEITAIRMGGVSIYRLIIPLLIMGALISSVTFLMNEQLVPWTNHRSQNIIRETILKDAMPSPEEEVFFKGPNGRLFYVSNYDQESGDLGNIIIYQLDGENEFPEMITAQEGVINENIWILKSGIIHEYNEEGRVIFESKFTNMELELGDEMQEISGTQKSTSEMSRAELGRRIELFKRSGININSLLVDYHLKLAQPLTALLFVLISVPLSLSGKESRTWNLVFTIIIIFFYYVVLSFSRSFGRNEVLSPILAAWLPNIIFLVLGVGLLALRESWQKIINRLFRSLGLASIIFLLLTLSFSFSVEAEEFRLSSDSLRYDQEHNILEVSSNISGNYGKYFIQSDEIEIKLKDGETQNINRAEEVEMLPGEISGCDFEHPHYLFDAKRVVIYPGEYMELFNVTFKELNGRLPLFYWPYLYISLKDEQSNFIPTFGYSESRGWFVKTKYFYNNRFDLPGVLYLDHYTISGSAAGIKQHLINGENQQAYLYYYSQQNKTNLSGLFNWEAEFNHQYEANNWEEEFNYFYQDYDDREEKEAELDIYNRVDRRRINLNLEYDERNYFEQNYRNSEIYELDAYYRNQFFDTTDLILEYDTEFDLDPEEGTDREENREATVRNRFDNGWRLDLNYYDGEKKSPKRPLLTRWGGEISAEKRFGDFNLEMLVERYAPSFSEEDEDKVRFTRLPELNLGYDPRGNFEYFLSYGKYYEDVSDTNADRLRAEVEYSSSNYLNSSRSLYFRNTHNLGGSLYSLDQNDLGLTAEKQLTNENTFRLRADFTNNLRLNNDYSYNQYWFESPFSFDQAEDKNLLENNLRYNINRTFDLELDSGYNFKEEEYLDLEAVMEYRPLRNWTLSLGTSYDLNESVFNENLIFKSIFEGERLTHKLGLHYDLNNSDLRELDNQLIYELEGDYGWYLESNLALDYDYEEEPIREANLQLKKNFHCRELAFSYDYMKEEFTVQYTINLFPSQGIGFTQSEDDTSFNLGIREQLESED